MGHSVGNIPILSKKSKLQLLVLSQAQQEKSLSIERICQGLGITLKDFFDSSYL